MLSGENRLSDASPAEPAPGAAPNPPLACAKTLLPLAVAGAVKPLPNPPPVEEKLKPEAAPNPAEAAGLSEVGAAKGKVEAEGAEDDPNPPGGCVGGAKALPKPVVDDDDGAAAEEPNPVCEGVKLKLPAWAGAGAPKPVRSERR